MEKGTGTEKESTKERVAELVEDLLPAREGYGPLLQRDYWALLAGSRLGPQEIADLVAERFPEFPPPELVTFRPAHAEERPLQVGDVLDIEIKLAGECQVRVVHRGTNSITLATLAGHPEAGRITFGAYRNPVGDVVFHIRSRARSADGQCFVGFLTAGEPMQTTTWSDFINRLALRVGQGVVGAIRAETQKVEELPEEDAPVPTFEAAGE